MAEIPTVTPKEVVIALVSGFGNTEARVKEPHDEAAANLEARGFTVVRVDPDYSKSGRPDDARGEIRQARTQAVDDGMRFVSWGTS